MIHHLLKFTDIAGEMATTAILDRLFHKANIFNIDGPSYRLRDFERMIKEGANNAG